MPIQIYTYLNLKKNEQKASFSFHLVFTGFHLSNSILNCIHDNN